MDKAFFIVGLGGTGGLLAPKLSKMFQNRDNIYIWLIDGDIVDEGNVLRQPYQSFNVNEKKATALSRKLSSNYNLNMYEYSEYIMDKEISNIAFQECYDEVYILGCVDNHSTRRILEREHIRIENSVYIDSANSLEDGSIFITENSDIFKGTLRSKVFKEILKADDHPTKTCINAINEGNTQQFVTNDVMANSVAMVVNNFMVGNKEVGVIKIDGLERVFTKEKN